MFCIVEVCVNLAETGARGYCNGHYQRWKRNRPMDTPIQVKSRPGEGRWKDTNGYYRFNRDGREVLEHRDIMEQIMGRELLPGENVHHKNGVRHDNRPENLELWSTSQPAGQRIEDKVAWAIETLALYAPHMLH